MDICAARVTIVELDELAYISTSNFYGEKTKSINR